MATGFARFAKTIIAASMAALLFGQPVESFAEGQQAVPKSFTGEIRTLKYETRTLNYQTQDLKGATQSLEIKETPLELKIELPGDVLFDFDKATIRRDAEGTLRQVADTLNQYPDAKVRIDGYTDSKGSDAHNLPLSRRRAISVRDWLERHGVKANFTVEGYGKANPVAPNTNPDGSDDPTGRQKNRRVEITVKKA
jgi:outer membrane protein OmpA-like peptidoglycan-associated protein